ncbi:mechanosensitive ion channel family protein [Spirosoma rhododendri]|uniref:Mechanosensitive ion channel family protein n=1 Tax=Spirosoma rhododendri TaxID=2728024 RepID=A0A7L5DP48_9BACT|nr:mechanosensitive ion channel family protein [Spirosoma rhododendri]QJD80166.1 mechanosensitive ion channel family protein [Spirosoma rhododendri]
MDFSQAADLIYAELMRWSRAGIKLIPNLGLAILILVVFSFLSRWVSQWGVRGLHRVSNNISLVNLVGALARVLLMAVGLFIALGVLGLDKTVASLLTGAGILALAVGFAFQDLTTNFISGTMIALARPVQVGDTVETNGYTGKVIDIKLRSIVIDNGQGQTVEIPSKDVFQKPITNYSRLGQRRIEVAANVSYLDDLDHAQRVAQQAIRQLPFVLPDRPVDLYYKNFGDNSIQFIVWFWVDPLKTGPLAAVSEGMKAIKRAFAANQITLFFPTVTYDLKQKQEDASTVSRQSAR